MKALVKTTLGLTEIIKVLELRKIKQGDTLPYENVVKNMAVVEFDKS